MRRAFRALAGATIADAAGDAASFELHRAAAAEAVRGVRDIAAALEGHFRITFGADLAPSDAAP